eukprot:gene18469-24960_t
MIVGRQVLAEEEGVPHISQCNFCFKCYLIDEELPAGLKRQAIPSQSLQTSETRKLLWLAEAEAAAVPGEEEEEDGVTDGSYAWPHTGQRGSDSLASSLELDVGAALKGRAGRRTARVYDTDGLPRASRRRLSDSLATLYASNPNGPPGPPQLLPPNPSLPNTADKNGNENNNPNTKAKANANAWLSKGPRMPKPPPQPPKMRPPKPPPKPPKPPKPPRPPRPPKPPAPPDPFEDETRPIAMRASAYLSTASDTVPKQRLPNCSVCHGCNTQLSSMASETQFYDRTFSNEKGATSSFLFRATTNKTASGTAVLKIYCMPIAKRENGNVPLCAPSTVLKNMRLLLAIQKVSEECGLNDIVPKIWVDRVDAIVPGMGYHIRWHGLWAEFADGVSMENFLNRGTPKRFPPPVILDLLTKKLNKTQVVRSAIFDLLTSQCDRHAQNMFINEHGEITLIDNEAALHQWQNCAVDSIFIPGTQKNEIIRLSNQFNCAVDSIFIPVTQKNEIIRLSNQFNCAVDSIFIPSTQKNEIIRLSNQFVLKLVSAEQPPAVLKLVPADQAPHGVADPQLLFDYRCYLPEGKEVIGLDYPPQIAQCLRRIADMNVSQVKAHYDLLEDFNARSLQTRAAAMIDRIFEYGYKYGAPHNAPGKLYSMINHGFEYGYKYGAPQNAPGKRYRIQPKCCSLYYQKHQYRCAHAWEPKFELPYGEPSTGAKWQKAGVDIGSYIGGTHNDTET